MSADPAIIGERNNKGNSAKHHKIEVKLKSEVEINEFCLKCESDHSEGYCTSKCLCKKCVRITEKFNLHVFTVNKLMVK